MSEIERDSAAVIREAAEKVLRAVDKGHRPNTTNSMRAAEGALALLNDLEEAADELLIAVPPPGSDLAKLLVANKLLRDERNRLRQELHLLWQHARDRVDWYDGEPEVAELAEKLSKPIPDESADR